MADEAVKIAKKLRQVSKFPIRLRVAWGAGVLERLLDGFSKYFRKTFRQDEALELAWDYALKGRDTPRRRHGLMDEIPELENKAAQDGYGREELLPVTFLLEEIDEQDGESVCVSVEYGAGAFINLGLYRSGYSLYATVPDDFPQSREVEFLRFAAECLEVAKQWGDKPIKRDFLSGVNLDFDAGSLKKKRPADKRVPKHETAGAKGGR
jgi:hypothetical protein